MHADAGYTVIVVGAGAVGTLGGEAAAAAAYDGVHYFSDRAQAELKRSLVDKVVEDILGRYVG